MKQKQNLINKKMKNYKLKFSPTSSSLYSWGSNSFGEYGNGDVLSKYYPTEIYFSNTITSISNSNFFTLFVDNGNLYFMGKGSSKSGIGTSFNNLYATPTLITGFEANWDTVNCSHNHCLAIYDSTNRIGYSWGRNTHGTLGNGTTSSTETYYPVNNLGSNWLGLYAATHASYGIKNTGSLFGWGTNYYGELGQGNLTNYYSPQQIGPFNDWVKFSCKNFHCAAIRDTGILYTWGFNEFGQLGTGTTTNEYSPTQIGVYTDWEMVSVGFDHTLAIRNGRLYAWGNNTFGQCGNGTTIKILSPTQIGVDTDWEYVESSMCYSIAIKNGQLHTWGKNYFANLGTKNYIQHTIPTKISNDNGFYFVNSNSDYTSFALRTVASPPPIPPPPPIQPIHAPYELKAWGLNNNAVFGTITSETTLYNPIPISITNIIPNFKSVEQISAGSNFALFIIKTIDGNKRLYYSGGNTKTHGMQPYTSSPNGCKFVTTNGTTHVAVFQNGLNNVAYSWGNNYNYMRGDTTSKAEDTFDKTVVDNPNGLKTTNSQPWKKISIGKKIAVGIGEDGTLYQWGILLPPSMHTPERISDYTDWIDVCAGEDTYIGLRSNGEVYTWGIKYGDLPPYRTTGITKVKILKNCKKISLTKATYFAIEGSPNEPLVGMLYAWGLNKAFMCGSSAIIGRDDPYLISYFSDWVEVKSGPNFVIATRKEFNTNVYSNYCWGENAGFAFGNGFSGIGMYVANPMLNKHLDSFRFENINNISGEAVFALIDKTTCFSNWIIGDMYVPPSGMISGILSKTAWFASNDISFKLSIDPFTQTNSFFLKSNVPTSNFIIGEPVEFSGFPVDMLGRNINGTYYITNTSLDGDTLWHEIQCSLQPQPPPPSPPQPPYPPFVRQDTNAFLKLFYSGGLNNNDPNKSLGGEMSNFIISTSKNNVFNNVNGISYAAGLTDYRCVFLKNTSPNRVLYLYCSLDDFFLGSILDLGFNFVNEIQSVTILNGPFTNGQEIVFSYAGTNFTVVYDTDFVTFLNNFNVSIKQVLGLEDVDVTGSSNGSNYALEITFLGIAGYKTHPLIELVGYNLTPTPTIIILKPQSGSPINTIPNKIFDSTREPDGITFYDASTTSPVYLPLLNSGDFLPIWLRRNVYPNTIAIENDGCNFNIIANYEIIET